MTLLDRVLHPFRSNGKLPELMQQVQLRKHYDEVKQMHAGFCRYHRMEFCPAYVEACFLRSEPEEPLPLPRHSKFVPETAPQT